MDNWNPDWDRKLSQPPFPGKRFTQAMMEEVEKHVKGGGRRDARRRYWETSWVVTFLSAFLIMGGVYAVLKMQNIEPDPIATPNQTAQPTSENTLGSGEPSAVLVLKKGEGGELDWWNDREFASYDKTSDAIIIQFVQALMQRKLGAMGGGASDTDWLWENPENKQVLAEYELSSPWISEVHVGVISENDEHRTYELRLLLTDSTQSEIRETIKVLVGKHTDKISQVETKLSNDFSLSINDSFLPE